MRRVIHLIIGLNKGGAETMLYNLLKHRKKINLEHRVISLLGEGYYGEKIRDLGIPVVVLDIRRNPIRSLWQCFREIRNADILSTWMYHANFLGFWVAKIVGCRRVVWNIRHSNLNPKLNRRTTIFICRLCGILSQFVSVIAYNGNESRRAHEAVGYDNSKSVVLDNGCDTSEYRKHENGKEYLLQELGLDGCRSPIILSVAKWSMQKDVPNLLKAAALLKKQNFSVKIVLCGSGLDAENPDFLSSLRENGLVLDEDVFGLGMRDDISQIMSGCDLFVLHSAGEAFPNVLIQAMACECACIATDVGDSCRILNNKKRIVPPKNSMQLANKIVEVLSELNLEVEGALNREQVLLNFSIGAVVADYERMWGHF